MKKAIIITSAIAATTFTACRGGSSSTAPVADSTAMKPAMDTMKSTMASDSTMASVKYTCPMHPEVISDTPGKCPKCGMTMVPIKPAAMKDSMPMKHDSTMKMKM
jgi:hypothetical protein